MSRLVTSDPAARRGYHHGNLREALVEAARRLSAEKGPQGFTLTEASRIAGVTPSAVYRHFKDRDALLHEVRRRGFALFGHRLAAAMTEGAPAPTEGLARMGQAYLAFAREEPGYYAAMFSFRGASPPAAEGEGRPPEEGASAAGPDAFATLVEAIVRVLPPGRAEGASPRLLALQVWAISHGVAMLERVGMPPPGSGAPPAEAILADAVGKLLRPMAK